jgi:hypothetical protein
VTRHEPLDEDRLIELFGEIEAPAGVDSWRERVSAEPPDVDTAPEPDLDPARVITPLPERWLRPPRAHRRATAVVAAVVSLIVGMGGVLIVSQMLTDAPPADPTMNIDDPDGTGIPTSSDRSSQTSQETQRSTVPPNGYDNGTAVQGGPDGGPDGGGGAAAPPPRQPVWGPMAGYPTADNTGVPSGSELTEHKGDLVIDTPGQVVTDLRVSGTVWVNAADVTLRRVVVVGVGGTNAIEQRGPRLRIQDSELSVVMGVAVSQRAPGLTMIRNKVSGDDYGIDLNGPASLIENYVAGTGIIVSAPASDIELRHNSFEQIRLSALGHSITGVIIRDNSLRQVAAPPEPGSSSIHVLDNVFHGDAPSTDWNPEGPDFVWSGNTHGDTGEPVSP